MEAPQAPVCDPALSRAWFDRDLAPLVNSPETYLLAGLRLLKAVYPIVEVGLRWGLTNGEIILHVDATDYHYFPPSGWWIDSGGTPLLPGRGVIPIDAGFQVGPTPSGIQRSWLCFQGWREFHEHPGHQEPSWRWVRSMPGGRFPGLLTQLASDLSDPRVRRV